MTTRIPRNAKKVFYASETVTRGERKFTGREQKSTTFREARAFLDQLDAPGNVSLWTEQSGQTSAYATRHADGSWTARNWFTGKEEPLA